VQDRQPGLSHKTQQKINKTEQKMTTKRKEILLEY